MRLYNPSKGAITQVYKKDGEPFEIIINPMDYSIKLSDEDARKILDTYKFLRPIDEEAFEKETRAITAFEATDSLRNQPLVRHVQKQVKMEYSALLSEIDAKLAELDDRNYLDALLVQNDLLKALLIEIVELNGKTRLPLYERIPRAMYKRLRSILRLILPKRLFKFKASTE